MSEANIAQVARRRVSEANRAQVTRSGVSEANSAQVTRSGVSKANRAPVVLYGSTSTSLDSFTPLQTIRSAYICTAYILYTESANYFIVS